MMQSPSNPRAAGVQHAATDIQSNFTNPKTVVNVHEMKTYAVKYGDDDGKIHTTVVSRLGDDFYLAPNGEEWTAKLRKAAPWLIEQILASVGKASDKTESFPSADVVDVVNSK